MLRRAGPEDAVHGWRLMREGIDTYRRFGIPGYAPPDESAEDFAARLAAEGAWGVVAEHDGEVVGIGAFEPARTGAREGEPVPGLAHVFAVFVREPHWGDGTATALLRAVTDEIAARGFEEARLFTPAAQARARRFYAREGWREAGEPQLVEQLGLAMFELRRPIRPCGRPMPWPAARP